MDDKPSAREGMGERQSSFARSFFSSDSNPPVLEQQGEPSSFSVPPSRGSRRRSSTRRQSNMPRGSQSLAVAAAASASASSASSSRGEKPSSSSEERADRANSWYADALRQQGETAQDLTDLLGDSDRAGQESATGWNDDEVLEQYRLMAQHEASLRVKENTGFDMKEYEKRRKLQGVDTQDKKSMYGGGRKPRLKLPEPKKITFSRGDFILRPMEPPPPPAFENRRYIEQRIPHVPELCAGEVYRSGTALAPDEHLVKCLGSCDQQLRVKRLATLVSCPVCNTVSPATSARR